MDIASLFRLRALAKASFSITSLRCTEPPDVLLKVKLGIQTYLKHEIS
jgi:hypothetical protein